MPASTSNPPLTQARLKELLHYDPETGVFVRLVSRGRAAAGSVAGSPDKNGYLQISIDKSNYLAHRLAFLHELGRFPLDEVDHIDRDPSNNRWNNLREATRSLNGANTRLRPDNASGHRGVYWEQRRGKWLVQGHLNGSTKYLGYFDRLEDAAAVSQAWRETHFREFAALTGQPSPNPVGS